MGWGGFLLAVAIGFVAGVGALGLDRLGLQPSWVSAATRNLGDNLLSLTRPPHGAPAFTKTVIIDLDEEAWEATTARPDGRSPAVREFDRNTIALTLAKVAQISPRPALVIVDVDVAPVADGAAEQTLNLALAAWNLDPTAPVLALLRTEDCGLPPMASKGSVLLRRWHPTPYDGLVAPTAATNTRIFWACAPIVPEPDGRARAFAPMGCGQQPDIAVPSAGLIASWVHRRSAKGLPAASDASQFEARYGSQLTGACNNQQPRDAELRRILPVVFLSKTQSETFDQIPLDTFLQIDPGRLKDWSGGLIVVGQSHLRSNDVHLTGLGPETTGPRLLAAYVETAVDFPPGRMAPWWVLVLGCLGSSLVTAASFALLTSLREVLVTKVFAHHIHIRRICHALLGPTPLSAFVTGGVLFTVAKLLGQYFSIEFWHQMASCLLSSFVAVALTDIVISDLHALLPRSTPNRS